MATTQLAHKGAAAAVDIPRLGHPQEQPTLRQRKALAPESDEYRADDEACAEEVNEKDKVKDEVTWGKTASGVVFRVPQTHSFVYTLLTTFTRSSLTRWTLFSLFAQPAVFFLLSGHTTLRSILFLVYFAFWRSAYDFGFAWVLRRQSEKRWVVRSLRKMGWLDVKSESGGEEGREWAKWWKRELEMKMGEGYSWEAVPQEYNSWLIFRQLVDVVLLNDFISYSLFAWSHLTFPANQGVLMHILRWTLGWSLIAFNLWVKIDAHRVVKDYAWYWGDAFWLMVMQHDLVFDGVYEIAPHPMYSVGYAGYYGLSMVVGSYTVFFVSLAAHAAQFAFLLWFENPHIDRTYGGAKKPLAARIPLDLGGSVCTNSIDEAAADSSFSFTTTAELPTPGITEGETETKPELPELPDSPTPQAEPVIRNRSDSSFSVSTAPTSGYDGKFQTRSRRAKSVSMHDLTHRFFRKPVVVLSRLDCFRATDFALVVLIAYSMFSLIPALPSSVGLAAHFVHALAWRLFHSYGLGLLLRAQSKSKWLVRHYLTHYHYPGDDGMPVDIDDTSRVDESVVKRATEEAFQNWQVGYNISLVMTYVSFAGLAWKTYHLPVDWTVSGTILRHVLGMLLIALHVWSAVSISEVLGDFGWFYSDFFLTEQIPSQLAYTGIYRFLNNPERSMGGAAFLGLSLISNSYLVFTIALISHLSHWWFLSCVEGPHMQRLYGDRLRKDGGLTKTLKSVAGKTLANRKHVPEIKRYVQEVRGSIEKVEVKVNHAVEEFLDHARPRLSEFAQDTKFLLQQSRERMIITRVARDMSAYDTTRYSMNLASSSMASTLPRFHVGQPIRVSWTAPSNHSRKDWIGIYRLGSCKSELVTKISSLGKWMPIFEEEYHGEEERPVTPEEQVSKGDAGEVVFRGDNLPWTPGQYELRYHHDGKHNVMSCVKPIEIFVNKLTQPETFKTVHASLLNIVCLALDSDTSLVPPTAKQLVANARASTDEEVTQSDTAPLKESLGEFAAELQIEEGFSDHLSSVGDSPSGGSLSFEETGQDPDDFVIMEEKQARRICQMCEWAYGVELSTDVVIADPNISALAKRVIGARSLIGTELGGG